MSAPIVRALRNDVRVFDHVTIRVTDRPTSQRFYETVLRSLGGADLYGWEDFVEWDDFSLAQADAENPATRRLHMGFAAPTREHVDAFWRAETAAGYESDGEPGPRPQYSDDYYGAFLLDPDGNSVEAVHHGARNGGNVDHLWIRVSVSRRRPGSTSGRAGGGLPRRQRVRPEWLLPAVENVHLAFSATDNETVDRFHRAPPPPATGTTAPGERAVYHEASYAAFVLDPDGTTSRW